ncbi:MAG: cell division protein FtsL [Deltaproteobacteria bacterium]|nr:cell division protein FtsL [Deltaproteobacteria bacterium]
MVRPMKLSEVEGNRNTRTGIRIINSRIRKRKFRLTHRQVFLIAIMLFLFMGSGIGYVWSNFEGTQIGYDLSRLQQEEFRLKEFNQKLRLELATMKSPQYLEKAARSLGLREALPEQIIILR